jgi:hypothetical protein
MYLLGMGGALALPCFALPVCVQALRVVGEGKRHRDEMADAVRWMAGMAIGRRSFVRLFVSFFRWSTLHLCTQPVDHV